MTTILIIYHSQSGNTKMMAESVASGARNVANVEVNLREARLATIDDLRDCDGIIVGSPEYFGYMAGMIKDFFDRTYETACANISKFRKPYCVFISAGNDGRNTEVQIERIIKGFPFKKVYKTIISRGEVKKSILDQCFEMGETLAAGCDLGIY